MRTNKDVLNVGRIEGAPTRNEELQQPGRLDQADGDQDTERANSTSRASAVCMPAAESDALPPRAPTVSDPNQWPANYVEVFRRLDPQLRSWAEERVGDAVVCTVRPAELEEARQIEEARYKNLRPQRDARMQADDALRKVRASNAAWRRVDELRRTLDAKPSGSVEHAGVTLIYQQALSAALQEPAYIEAKTARDARNAEYERAAGGSEDREYQALLQAARFFCLEIKDSHEIIAALFDQYPKFVVPMHQWMTSWLRFMEQCHPSNGTAARFATHLFFDWALDTVCFNEWPKNDNRDEFFELDWIRDNVPPFVALFEEHRNMLRLFAHLIARAYEAGVDEGREHVRAQATVMQRMAAQNPDSRPRKASDQRPTASADTVASKMLRALKAIWDGKHPVPQKAWRAACAKFLPDDRAKQAFYDGRKALLNAGHIEPDAEGGYRPT